MTDSSCRSLIERCIPDYQSGSREERRKLLREVVELTGYSEKHAIKLLNHGFAPASDQRRGRRPQYDDEVKRALIKLWQASGCLCSKRLVPFLGDLLPILERHGHLCVLEPARTLLLSISASTADRLLAPERARWPRGLGTTKPGHNLSKQIPVRTHNGPSRDIPGYFECDLVAHCGRSVRGSFLYTLVMTDIHTGWTDFEPIGDRTAACVVEAIRSIRGRLPFAVLGLDTDNGAEFINESVHAYCCREQIEFTRSRPYKKNDQAHVEQKNGSVVRRHAGYERYDGATALKALREVYSILRIHLNYFQPSMKLAQKQRSGDKVSRKHEVAKTPLQRLLSSHLLEAAQKQQFRLEFTLIDPLALLRQLALTKERFQACACTEPPEKLTPKARRPLPAPTRKNCSSTVFHHVWRDVEKAFARKKKVCVQRLFADLQSKYPGLLQDQQIHMFRKYVHAWQSSRQLPTTNAHRGAEALANTTASR
jgi:hypothetical protein